MKAKPYSVLVCGGRDYRGRTAVFEALDRLARQQNIGLIINGGATGADEFAAQWARSRAIPFLTHPADWEKHGKAAGPVRNAQMLKMWEPDFVLAFPGGRGTESMVALAEEHGFPVGRVGW